MQGSVRYTHNAAEDEKRRPGFAALMHELRSKHPHLSEETLRGKAKLVWMERNPHSPVPHPGVYTLDYAARYAALRFVAGNEELFGQMTSAVPVPEIRTPETFDTWVDAMLATVRDELPPAIAEALP